MATPSDVQDLAATTATLTLASRDPTYFLTWIIFQVEGTLFSVPRHQFERNEVFATVFHLPPPPGEQAEGSSEQSPLKLEKISKKDFQAFLSVLCPLTIPVQYSDINTEDWKSVLELSHMWNFEEVRNLAIRELSGSNRLDSVSKILLGIKYDVARWVILGCSDLIIRTPGPRTEEAMLLKEDLTTLIWDLREQKIWNLVGREYPYNMEANITKVFADYVTFNSDNGMRNSAEEEKSRAEARISILESVKAQFTKRPQNGDVDAKELERLMRLANKTAGRETDKVLGDDVGWGDIFSGKPPKGGNEGTT